MAGFICGNFPTETTHFVYRSSKYLTEFFEDADLNYQHNGTTRDAWVKSVLQAVLADPSPSAVSPPDAFARIIQRLMDLSDSINDDENRSAALAELNTALARDGYEVFRNQDKQHYLRHIGTNFVSAPSPNPHRPFSQQEVERREQLSTYLDRCSEDDLIEQVLLPLFRQLGHHRITAAGHKDKALEYGKDIWMRFQLPSQHFLYFGIQAKKGKLDSSGVTKNGNANMAEIYNQTLMMLGHEIFDPEIGKRILVDHAFIVAGGEITKQARNWLGNKLDTSKRSQIMFMDRDDVLNLYVVTNLPFPVGAVPDEPTDPWGTLIPF